MIYITKYSYKKKNIYLFIYLLGIPYHATAKSARSMTKKRLEKKKEKKKRIGTEGETIGRAEFNGTGIQKPLYYLKNKLTFREFFTIYMLLG